MTLSQGSHIRYPAYQKLTLRFITVEELQLWSSSKNNFMAGGHPNMRNCIMVRTTALERMKLKSLYLWVPFKRQVFESLFLPLSHGDTVTLTLRTTEGLHEKNHDGPLNLVFILPSPSVLSSCCRCVYGRTRQPHGTLHVLVVERKVNWCNASITICEDFQSGFQNSSGTRRIQSPQQPFGKCKSSHMS